MKSSKSKSAARDASRREIEGGSLEALNSWSKTKPKRTRAKPKPVTRFPRYPAQARGKRRQVKLLLIEAYDRVAWQKSPRKRQNKIRLRDLPGWSGTSCWLTLAAHRIQEAGIDPALYIKILSRYSWYGRNNWMPPPSWLGSDKALEVYGWLSKAERDKYETDQDWRATLKSPGLDLREEIRREIERGKAQLREFGGDLQVATLTNATVLPDWYLVACREFWSAGGEDTLPVERQREVRAKQKLLGKRNDLKELAYSTYWGVTPL